MNGGWLKLFLIDEMKYLYIFAMTGFMNDPREYDIFEFIRLHVSYSQAFIKIDD